MNKVKKRMTTYRSFYDKHKHLRMPFISQENFDSFILMAGLIQETFKFGYSYDITVSELKNSNTLGAHELSFTYFLPCRSKSKTYNTISCPQF